MSARREPDLVALVDALNRHRVDYVLVGGMAALIYRASRPTEDVDILARDMDDNMERLAAALNDLDAASDVAEHASIDELRAMNTRWITSAGVVDVLVSARGPGGTTINWRTIDPGAQTIDVDGHRIRIAALEDLLVMKLSVGRQRDIEVAEQLAPSSSRAFTERFGDQTQPTATPPSPTDEGDGSPDQ